MRCQACASELKPVLSLGYMPPVNDLRPVGELARSQVWMPTDLMVCEACDLVQLGYVGDPQVVFPAHYPYTSASTRVLRDNFTELADEANSFLALDDDLVVDIGSNDGTLLSNFVDGNRVVGIEPTDIADRANANGVRTIKQFFDRNVAREIKAQCGSARLVTCANCFAHIPDVHGVIEGIKELIGDDGVFVSESHYLMALLDSLQYDTIYHEHLRYYSFSSLRRLLEGHGLKVFWAKQIPTHGGSIRVYASKQFRGEMIEAALLVEPTGQNLAARLSEFAGKVWEAKRDLLRELFELKGRGYRICGIGAPSRAATVVNYCRLDHSLIDYICEVPTSLKVGRYMPGTDIPVVDEERLFREQPQAAVLFSWHIADELIPKLRAKGYRGQFVLPCNHDRKLAQAA